MNSGRYWLESLERNWPRAKRVSPQTDWTPFALFLYPVVQVEGVTGQSRFTWLPSGVSKTSSEDIWTFKIMIVIQQSCIKLLTGQHINHDMYSVLDLNKLSNFHHFVLLTLALLPHRFMCNNNMILFSSDQYVENTEVLILVFATNWDCTFTEGDKIQKWP